jgi:hypothetical protein
MNSGCVSLADSRSSQETVALAGGLVDVVAIVGHPRAIQGKHAPSRAIHPPEEDELEILTGSLVSLVVTAGRDHNQPEKDTRCFSVPALPSAHGVRFCLPRSRIKSVVGSISISYNLPQ